METFLDAVESPDQLPTAEYRFRTADGGWLWLESRGSDRIDEPDLTGFVVNARDISERKARERELERYETIVETVSDGVYTLDPDGVYTYVNRHFEEIFDRDRDEIVGERASRFVSDDAVDEFQAAVAEMLAGERELFDTELDIRRPDGSTVPTEVKQTILAADGDFEGSVGVLRTIRDRRERERELERYETMVDLSGDPIYTLDAGGTITFVSKGTRDLSGYAPDELVGEPASFIMEDADVERGEQVIRTLLESDDRHSGTFEMRLRTKQGNRIPCENHIALLTDEDGTFRGSVGILRDISEQKARQEQLERQNEYLEQFTSMVSHDLRNPLNVAQGRLDLAREECASDELDGVDGALDRMDALIEDLLEFARHGQRVRDPSPVALGPVVERAWASLDAGGDLRSEVDDLRVVADRDRLVQVFENLLRNAVEHAGPRVTVRVGPLDDGRGFYVEDDGSGIPPDEREAVFDHGYSTSDRGTGFGLFIVRSVVDAHGWAVAATEGRDGGARIEVSGVAFAGSAGPPEESGGADTEAAESDG